MGSTQVSGWKDENWTGRGRRHFFPPALPVTVFHTSAILNPAVSYFPFQSSVGLDDSMIDLSSKLPAVHQEIRRAAHNESYTVAGV